MTSLLLPSLTAVVAALLALGPLAWFGAAGIAARAAPALCGLGALLAVVALIGGAPAAALELPFGLPGSGILLALDGLSAFFLLLLFVAGAAVTAAAIRAPQPAAPVLLGTLAATLLAADGFSLVLAFEATALATAALALGTGENSRPTAWRLGGGVAGGLALVAAMALLAPLQAWGLDLSFSGMRGSPPEGARASAVFLLVLLGGAVGGLWPGRGGAASTLAAPVGLYLLARVLFDLAGPAQPGWWGAVLVVAGAATALRGAASATRADDLPTLAGAMARVPAGLAGVGVGLALAARSADLAPLAALALAAALLLASALALAGTLLLLAAAAAEAGAGTKHLDRLGGLLRGMPATTLCTLVAAASFAVLPTSIGFAAVWTLFQALLGTARAGGLGWQALATLAVLAVAAAGALGAVAAVRLVGIGFLGRPRTPRAAAAPDAPLPVRVTLLALAALTLAAGIGPGVLLGLAEPALLLLVGTGMAERADGLAIAPLPEAPALLPAALAALLALVCFAVLRVTKIRAGVGHHAGAAWEGGGPPPPPWLPFGDPATQAGAAGFAAPLPTALARLRPRLARPTNRLWRRWRGIAARADRLLFPPAQAALAALAVAALVLLLALVLAQRA